MAGSVPSCQVHTDEPCFDSVVEHKAAVNRTQTGLDQAVCDAADIHLSHDDPTGGLQVLEPFLAVLAHVSDPRPGRGPPRILTVEASSVEPSQRNAQPVGQWKLDELVHQEDGDNKSLPIDAAGESHALLLCISDVGW